MEISIIFNQLLEHLVVDLEEEFEENEGVLNYTLVELIVFEK